MALLVNWEGGLLKPAPRKNRPNQRETWYPVVCSECGAEYELRASDAKRRTRCRYCGLRASRLTNRAWSEELVQTWLDELATDYQIEQVLVTEEQAFVVDFVVDGKAIEVNGWGHKLFNRAARDAKLVDVWPGEVYFISTSDLRERPQWAKAQLQAIVQ